MVASRLVGAYDTFNRLLDRRTLTRVTRALPRTLGFTARTARRGEVAASVPAPKISAGFITGVAMDETLLAVAMTPNRFPRKDDYRRVAEELATAHERFASEGWLPRPEAYHRTPPPLTETDLDRRRGWALGRFYEQIAFDSEFAPRPGEPGAERWESHDPNKRAYATILRHPGAPRPWVVAIHGFCMGYPFMDFAGLGVGHLHNQLGFNVAMPILPLHGPRKVTRISGEAFLGFDLMNTVHALAQSVFDVRRVISWIRAQDAPSVSLYGVSLGAYVASLVAGIEDDLGAIVAGVPVVDFPRLFHEHSPVHIRARAIEHRIVGGPAEEVFRVVCPLSFSSKVPLERRAVFAGYGDRLAFPEQAHALWEHWERPAITWYPGNHVGYLWSRRAGRAVTAALAPLAGRQSAVAIAGS